MKFIEWFKKNSVYIMGVLIIGFSGIILVTKLDFASIPEGLWAVFGAVGLGFMRAIIADVSKGDNKGWKSYASAVAIAIVGGLKLAGVVMTPEVTGAIITALGTFGITGITAAIKKVGDPNAK